MKKVLLLVLLSFTLFSCEKEELQVPCVWTELTIAGDTETQWICLPKSL